MPPRAGSLRSSVRGLPVSSRPSVTRRRVAWEGAGPPAPGGRDRSRQRAATSRRSARSGPSRSASVMTVVSGLPTRAGPAPAPSASRTPARARATASARAGSSASATSPPSTPGHGARPSAATSMVRAATRAGPPAPRDRPLWPPRWMTDSRAAPAGRSNPAPSSITTRWSTGGGPGVARSISSSARSGRSRVWGSQRVQAHSPPGRVPPGRPATARRSSSGGWAVARAATIARARALAAGASPVTTTSDRTVRSTTTGRSGTWPWRARRSSAARTSTGSSSTVGSSVSSAHRVRAPAGGQAPVPMRTARWSGSPGRRSHRRDEQATVTRSSGAGCRHVSSCRWSAARAAARAASWSRRSR